MEFTSHTVEHTQQLGMQLGGRVAAGDVVALIGELGSGKTTLIQGIAQGLGIEPARVTSPTFILLREYAGRLPLVHVDAYRLENASAAVWMDLDWMLSPRKVTVIEWADRIAGCLPDDHLEIHLSHKRTNLRTIRAVSHGPRSCELVEELRNAVHSPQTTVHSEGQ